jgi:hypothetical protein
MHNNNNNNNNNNSLALVRERNTSIPTELTSLVGKVSAFFFRIDWCRVVSAAYPHGRIPGFQDRSRYYFFQVAKLTPFQIHCLSENMLVPGIELGSLDLSLRTLTT